MHKLYGGLGDDLIGPSSYGKDGALGTSYGIKFGLRYGLSVFGGEGNDRIEAFSGTGASESYGATLNVFGGAGNDKILGATDVGGGTVKLYGNEGDDIVYGSNGT